DDIDSMINTILRFQSSNYMARIGDLWAQGDKNLEQLIAEGEKLHLAILKNGDNEDIRESLERIESLNYEVTRIEDEFSYTLSEGSRWLEVTLRNLLLFAVLLVAGTGVFLAISFSRNLSRGLKELIRAAQNVGRGLFNARVKVRTTDEVGELAMA